MPKMPHNHICTECDAAYPCPDPDQCQRTTAEGRIGLCPQCKAPGRRRGKRFKTANALFKDLGI
jgi:hypothetical protein